MAKPRKGSKTRYIEPADPIGGGSGPLTRYIDPVDPVGGGAGPLTRYIEPIDPFGGGSGPLLMRSSIAAGDQAAAPLNVLCVHGIGGHPPGGSWEKRWTDVITAGVQNFRPGHKVLVEFVYLDDIFDDYEVTFWDGIRAIGKLIGNALTSPFRRKSAERGTTGSLRWTAGMVVQWVENGTLRRRTRQLLAKEIRRRKPDVICGHSLGSLVCYDTFTDGQGAALVRDRVFISLGSQIANPFVTGSFLAGRIAALEKAKHWYHLFNPDDPVFTDPIRVHANNFTQVVTEFGSGFGAHDAIGYLGHPEAMARMWGEMLLQEERAIVYATSEKQDRDGVEQSGWARPPTKRALLIGINEYPRQADRLEGCVNDVFLMSSLLQDLGYEPENIRVALDERATAKGILDRLEWLVSDLRSGDERVFYYSGHGAQMPIYGLGGVVDTVIETLVPWDFDWTPEHAITDRQFRQLYSQLPYHANFAAIFDCCHSGGLTRDGGARVRGIDPPDDVRHRALQWNLTERMWEARPTKRAAKAVANMGSHRKERVPGVERIGQALSLRSLDRAPYVRRRKQLGHLGPYMPILFYACSEDQLASEYRHGNVSYGAFTYSMAQSLRRAKTVPTFEKLLEDVRKQLKALEYSQIPQLDGPQTWRESKIPGVLKAPAKRKTPKKPKRRKRS